MAFTGTAVVVSQGKYAARITGISLAAGANGTITAAGGGGDVTLPSTHPGISDNTWPVVNHAASPAAGTPLVSVAKSGAPTDTITLTNEDGVNATGNLEVFIIEPHSIVK